MKYYEVGFDAGVCYSCNIIQGETETACRYAAEQHAKRYGYTVGYFTEIDAAALEYNRKPVWSADRYPEPTEPEQPETEPAEADETETENNEEEETMYNYEETMKNDILDYIADNIDRTEFINDRDGLEEKLNDDLFVDDSVTGNASGSYFCNAYRAREAFQNDRNAEDYFAEACDCFDCDPAEVGRRFIRGDYEWIDCTIRCYLLGGMIQQVLDELEEAGYFEESETDEADILQEVREAIA